MSKKSLSKQLLSAYFDGEVTAEERAEVSRAAAQTPAIQQVLDDYAQLSETLQSLRQNVPAPGLSESVMAALAVAPTPTTMPTRAKSVSSASGGRRWMQIAGVVTSIAAVGLMVMIWPAGPQRVDRAEMAQNDPQPEGQSADGRMSGFGMADNAPIDVADRAAESMLDDVSREATADADDAPVRVAAIPVESLMEQVAKDRQIPQPGDVVKYLAEVADETVWISLTVVDVQLTAGEIRVLLTNHGIESPVEVDADAIGSSMDSNVVILVESDWEKVAEVVEDLETQGYGVTQDVETSVAMQQVQIEQNRSAPLAKELPVSGEESLAASASAVQPRVGAPASPAPASAVPAVPAETTKPRSSGMLHAQLSARVSDRDVHAFELRGQPIFSNRPADNHLFRGQVPRQEQALPTAEPMRPLTDTLRHDTKIFASPSPARVVFVIKKSK